MTVSRAFPNGQEMSTAMGMLNELLKGTACPWPACGEWITKDNCAAHLAHYHGIKGMSSRHRVKCQACNPPKFIKRESMLRHFIEVHIKIKRKLCKRKREVMIACHILPDCSEDVSQDLVES